MEIILCLRNRIAKLMDIVLIGQKESKRTTYFFKAADQLKASINFFELGSPLINMIKEGYVKIDPPQYTDCNLSNLNTLAAEYIGFLQTIPQNKNLVFLNSPKSIIHTLDKKRCKELLVAQDVAVTTHIRETISDIHMLRHYARENKVYGLFIKPRYGSGAAGVIAYRYNPKINQEIIYTSINESNGTFINTKRIKKICNVERIEAIVNFILGQDPIMEKWVPKPTYKNLTYDIRVVYQFGKIDFMVARCSSSPITNLHLNNYALNMQVLKLSQQVLHKIDSLCKNAVTCFDGLNSASIDLLLQGTKLDPKIIEINAQGDLIYQDIYNENRIYTNQVVRMVSYA